jgi:hypothetical protein
MKTHFIGLDEIVSHQCRSVLSGTTTKLVTDDETNHQAGRPLSPSMPKPDIVVHEPFVTLAESLQGTR